MMMMVMMMVVMMTTRWEMQKVWVEAYKGEGGQ